MTDCQVLDKYCSSTAESPVILTYQALKGFLNIQSSLTWTTLEFLLFFFFKKSNFYSFSFPFLFGGDGVVDRMLTKVRLVKDVGFLWVTS